MSEKYVIGIDEGSQSAKILIFDLKGNIVCEDSNPCGLIIFLVPAMWSIQMMTGGMRSAKPVRNVWRNFRGIQKIS